MIWGVLRAIGIKGGLLIALALFVGLCWYKWGAWKEEAGEWKQAHAVQAKATKAWRDAFTAQKQSYVAAQIVARKKAIDAKNRDLKTYRILAERADNADKEIDRYRALADRYARANSVRRSATGTAASAAGGTDRAGPAGATPGDHGSGGDAGVVISRTEFDTLVENTLRLKRAHDFGEELIAAGLAVKAPD